MTTAADIATVPAPPKRGFLQRHPIVRRLLRHRAFMVGTICFGIIVILAVLADVLTPADPNRLAVRFRFRPPSWEFWFGTDNLGRTQLGRVLYGARLSLMIGLSVVILNAVFGVMLGAAAGYFRGSTIS
jgi:peptide/nickel transport system permease protein